MGGLYRHGFSRWTANILGIVQIIIGLVLIGLQAAGIIYDTLSTHIGAAGIWGGVFVILTGSMAIVAGKIGTNGVISGFMTVSILTTFVAAAVVISSTWSAVSLKKACDSNASFCPEDAELRTALDIGIIVAGLVEYCVAFSSAIVCCWALCCEPGNYRVNDNSKMDKDFYENSQNMENGHVDRTSSLYDAEEIDP